MTWHPVAQTADLAEGQVIGRTCAGRSIALYRVEGEYWATSGTCTHANALLCEGEVVDGYIECPVHFALFEIRTGKATGGHASCDLDTYPVRVAGTWIEIGIGP